MRKITFLLLSTVLFATSVYAGGSIFGHHKKKSSNPYGVYAINVHICDKLECPEVRIIEGSCDGANMEKRWGVCVCEAGYVSQNGACVSCPEGQYSDGITGCQACPEGTYRAGDNDTTCTECPEAPECPADNPCCTLTGPNDICGRPTPVLGFKNRSYICYSCTNTGSIFATATECAKCDDTDTPRKMFGNNCGLADCGAGKFHNNSGNCYDCSNTGAFYGVSQVECAKCDDTATPRVMFGNHCGLADCGEGKFQDNNGYCNDCSATSSYDVSQEECAKCDNTDYPRQIFTYQDEYGTYSYCGLTTCGENQFHDSYGNCYDCSADWAVIASAEECDQCNNTDYPRIHFINSNEENICALPCSSGQFMDNYGYCYDCSEMYSSETPTTEECNKCNNTGYPRQIFTYQDEYGTHSYCGLTTCGENQFHSDYGDCHDCSADWMVTASAAHCAECNNSPTPRTIGTDEWGNQGCVIGEDSCPGGFMDNYGFCHDCSVDYSIYDVSAEQCAKCDYTDYPRQFSEDEYGNTYCTLACGEGQFRDNNGYCRSCLTNDARISASDAECDKCGDKREIFNSKNGNTYCSLHCPEGQFLNEHGECKDCSDTAIHYNVKTEECAKCDNTDTPRFLGNDGYCYSCSITSGFSSSAEECAKCGNTDTPRFLSKDGRCNSCSITGGYSSSAEECSKCGSQRTYNSETGQCSKV